MEKTLTQRCTATNITGEKLAGMPDKYVEGIFKGFGTREFENEKGEIKNLRTLNIETKDGEYFSITIDRGLRESLSAIESLLKPDLNEVGIEHVGVKTTNDKGGKYRYPVNQYEIYMQ